jgi:hypothetical protein
MPTHAPLSRASTPNSTPPHKRPLRTPDPGVRKLARGDNCSSRPPKSRADSVLGSTNVLTSAPSAERPRSRPCRGSQPRLVSDTGSHAVQRRYPRQYECGCGPGLHERRARRQERVRRRCGDVHDAGAGKVAVAKLPPNGAFDAGLRPDPFPDRTASLLPSLLVATRTGLTSADDDELMLVSATRYAPTLGARTTRATRRRRFQAAGAGLGEVLGPLRSLGGAHGYWRSTVIQRDYDLDRRSR